MSQLVFQLVHVGYSASPGSVKEDFMVFYGNIFYVYTKYKICAEEIVT
jgi:hypothetical protein